MNQKNTLLSIQNISKYFNDSKAVNSLSLDIYENEFFALLGSSGSGKTTLLRMLAGLEAPTEGIILLDGEDMVPVHASKRPVNLMFQSYALFPHMTVEQNIAYGLEMERMDRSLIEQKVEEMLDIIKLKKMAKRRPDQLSGGQRQRVALARALVKRPRLLLLDEPLGALDKKLRSEMQLELKRLQHEVGITFVIVTHDQDEALVMADRIAIMRDGKLLQCGTPQDIYEYPKNRFAADFIGEMNFIPGVIHNNTVVTSTKEQIKVLSTEGFDEGTDVVAAIRPERISLQEVDDENSIVGKIQTSAYHGMDILLHVTTELVKQPILVRVPIYSVGKKAFEVGDFVQLYWSEKDTRVFTNK